MCAGSFLAVKNAMTPNFGLLWLAFSVEQPEISAATAKSGKLFLSDKYVTQRKELLRPSRYSFDCLPFVQKLSQLHPYGDERSFQREIVEVEALINQIVDNFRQPSEFIDRYDL